MSRKRASKPYWEMNLEELRAATAEFDEEFVEDKFRPLTPEERARWEKIRSGSNPSKGQNGLQVITIRLDKELLDRCTALAKKKRITRDRLIARGLKAILAAEGEGE
jgi:hypothetical protein